MTRKIGVFEHEQQHLKGTFMLFIIEKRWRKKMQCAGSELAQEEE